MPPAKKAPAKKAPMKVVPPQPNRATRRATPKKAPVKHVVREYPVKPKGTADRLSQLEHDMKIMIWLHAELSYSLRLGVARAAARAQAQGMEEQLVKQMMNQGGGLNL